MAILTETDRNVAEKIKAEDLADFLLDIGVLLLSSGAHCGRVWRNCNRIAEHWGMETNINPTITGMLISVWDANNKENAITRYKSAPENKVHFEILTLVSHLSWKITRNQLCFDEAKQEVAKIQQTKNYNYWIVGLMVGISCACLCRISGGDWMDFLITFSATFCGSIGRTWIIKLKFNNFLSFIIASFITTTIASLDTIFHIGVAPEMTLATAVLYLIPGVPLINSVIDLLEGYLNSALARSLFAASIVSCIATGMILSIMLLGIN